jgi:hypothetical protein
MAAAGSFSLRYVGSAGTASLGTTALLAEVAVPGGASLYSAERLLGGSNTGRLFVLASY